MLPAYPFPDYPFPVEKLAALVKLYKTYQRLLLLVFTSAADHELVWFGLLDECGVTRTEFIAYVTWYDAIEVGVN
jgi:hypothetical protein